MLPDSHANQVRDYIVRDPTQRESIPQLSPILLVSILSAVSLAIWWGPLTSSFALALDDQQYTHILRVLSASMHDLIRPGC